MHTKKGTAWGTVGTVEGPIHYEVDDDEVATVLRLAEYGGEEEGSWVLIEPVALAAAAAGQ